MNSPGGGPDVNDINSIINGLNSDRINIPGTILTAGKTYVFELGVANFLNLSNFVTVTHSIQKSADPVPALTLNFPVEPYVSEPVFIKATAVVSPVSSS